MAARRPRSPKVGSRSARARRPGTQPPLSVRPLAPARFAQLEALFGPRGACGGCWCMWWRISRSEFDRRKGAANRRALRSLVAKGRTPGLLAYAGHEPVAWCALGPRADFPALARSRILKPVDDTPVWSIVCLFVRADRRRQGLSVEMLRAAVAHAARRGARVVEGYPVEPRKDAMPDLFAFTGLASAFREAGFSECARRSETRPIMRIDTGRSRNARRSGAVQ